MDGQPDEELVGSNSNARNWKGIGLSFLVIFFVCSMIVMTVIIKKPQKNNNYEQTPITLDDIISQNFEPKRFNGFWTSGETFVYQTDHLNLMLFDCNSQTESILMSNNTIKQLVGSKFKFFVTNDPTFVLLSYDIKNLYRHSITSRYKIFNTISNVSYDVLPTGVYSTDQIQNAILSPNSRKLAFVFKNNIYLMEGYFDGSKDSIKITNDGKDSFVYNGITNWLYEEEILYQTNAMWWSPKSINLAYIKFNDTHVKFYEFPIYDGSPYGNFNRVRYPKPDTQNPFARVYIYNTKTKQNIELDIPFTDIVDPLNCYIWTLKWLSENSLIVVYVNRRQNKSLTVIYEIFDINVNPVQKIYQKKYPTAPLGHEDGWFLPHGLLVSPLYNYYFQIWPYEGFKAIISFDTKTGEAYPVAHHKFDVLEMLYFSEKTGELYYLATNGDPKQRHLFRKRVKDASRIGHCLTCNSSIKIEHDDPSAHMQPLASENNCLYHSAHFSVNGDYYILECLGDRVPISWIKNAENSSYSYVLEKNEELSQKINKKILPRRSYLRVNLDNSSNFYSDAEILYPPNFDPIRKVYPVLIYVYNGPSSQLVDFQFRIRKFEAYLCVNFEIIIASMDGRGTDSNGDKFMKSVANRLGELETIDQIALANSLKKEVYVLDESLSIWGWSYGGFVSAMALFQEKTPFKCAVSGAPVTDWLKYDSAYTERYLGYYFENRHAYEKANLTSLAEKNQRFFDKRKLLLIHGTGDDNVHFQHSANLAKVLRKTKLDLEFEVYPDVPHTPDEETQQNLYQQITKFLLNCYDINYHKYYEQLNYHHLIETTKITYKDDAE